MKRNRTLLFILLVIIQGCNTDSKFPDAKKLSGFQNTDFVPTLEHDINKNKNTIYCSTLLLAWDEIKSSIQTPWQVDSSLHDLQLLNRSQSYLGTLKEGEYTSDADIKDDLIVAKAEFRKSLPFEWRLSDFDNVLTFKNQKVKSFGVFGYKYEAAEVIKVLYYRNDNNFLIKLLPKDREHEILLYMAESNFKSMSDLVQEIDGKLKLAATERYNTDLGWKFFLAEDDEVVIPSFSFNIEANYTSLEGNTFRSEDRQYKIEEAWQRTAFVLNENGAEIESESEVVATLDSVAVEETRPKPKKMRFDKPFFLMLKRVDSKHPYFGLWVADTELMTKQ